MQLALILGEDMVTIHNISSRSFEPECLRLPPAGKHCIATPHGEVLLMLYPTSTPPAAASHAAASGHVELAAVQSAEGASFHNVKVWSTPKPPSHCLAKHANQCRSCPLATSVSSFLSRNS